MSGFKTVFPRWCLLVCGLWLLCLPPSLLASSESGDLAGFGAISQLPPGEQYRQLSLLLLLANGADSGLLDYLATESASDMDKLGDQAEALQQYPTPLARIADPDSMLQGAGQMMRFAQQNRAAIEQELARIQESWPVLVSMIDMNAVREDAIIIRSAVADSLQYHQPGTVAGPGAGTVAGTVDGSPGLSEDSLLAYRSETLHQRNTMEYLLFQGELDGITDAAIDELSYKLDAYQRMADDEMDPELLKERIEAADDMNEETRKRYREQAYIRASTLYLMLIPAMVTVVTD
ncbi:MAG TPA: hypothetical protein VFG52_10940 [Xanthomonadales bacterium]|nr:hypothetical protein [Xanthomonadales bacterium]